MYLRYRATYFNASTNKVEYGFFWAADYLQKSDLEVQDRDRLDELVHWFDHNLPIPDYYQDEKNRQEAKSATSWFKDTAIEYIDKMNELGRILTKNNVNVERISRKQLKGKKIYEDEFQVTIIPFKDSIKKVK